MRLLVGVGRYSEMSYIIDALREHEQFEPLLGRETVEERGSAKGLDQALVHYLRSKYPQDTDTLRLVALHFLLYSEVNFIPEKGKYILHIKKERDNNSLLTVNIFISFMVFPQLHKAITVNILSLVIRHFSSHCYESVLTQTCVPLNSCYSC